MILFLKSLSFKMSFGTKKRKIQCMLKFILFFQQFFYFDAVSFEIDYNLFALTAHAKLLNLQVAKFK